MGSGNFANEGWTHTAYQNTICFIPHGEAGGIGEWPNFATVSLRRRLRVEATTGEVISSTVAPEDGHVTDR
jgi:hypothetical protein